MPRSSLTWMLAKRPSMGKACTAKSIWLRRQHTRTQRLVEAEPQHEEVRPGADRRPHQVGVLANRHRALGCRAASSGGRNMGVVRCAKKSCTSRSSCRGVAALSSGHWRALQEPKSQSRSRCWWKSRFCARRGT